MSPEVWDDAIARIQAVAKTLGLPVELPNEDAEARPSPPSTWISVQVMAQTAGPMQIGYDAWEERGQVFVTVMVPFGQGLRDALVARKTFSTAFRGINFTGELPVGLRYTDDQVMDLSGPPSEDGVYTPVPLVIHYTYQDRLTNPPPY